MCGEEVTRCAIAAHFHQAKLWPGPRVEVRRTNECDMNTHVAMDRRAVQADIHGECCTCPSGILGTTIKAYLVELVGVLEALENLGNLLFRWTCCRHPCGAGHSARCSQVSITLGSAALALPKWPSR